MAELTGIIDYGGGNGGSVANALRRLGAPFCRVTGPRELPRATRLILPGVGHFGAMIEGLERRGLRQPILAAMARGVPFLGVCVGLQALFEGSDEAPAAAGLGVWRGRVRRFPGGGSWKVPHVGWNAVHPRGASRLLAGAAADEPFYFTHSFYAPVTAETSGVAAYPAPFTAVAEMGPVAGVQFHPEKSGAAGQRVLSRFLEDGPELAASGLLPRADALRPMRRIIPCLDFKDGRVVKGVRFVNLRDSGDAAALARAYDAAGADELVLLNIAGSVAPAASWRGWLQSVASVAAELRIPFCVGGGVRRREHAAALLAAGADKVAVNTAALARPALLGEVSAAFGAQAVVAAIDAKRVGASWRVFSHGGALDAGRDAVAWAREAEARGAGEILLTSMDRDGTRSGFDCELTAAVAAAVRIPVIASGGGGRAADFAEVLASGRADAALAASLFHTGELPVDRLKRELSAAGVTVRL